MRLKSFAYDLPKNLIAQKPIRPRDHSRLLVIRRGTTNSAHANGNKQIGKIEHRHFYDIVDYLKKGDVLVLNNTKVMPARLIGRKTGTGGRVEVFLLKKVASPPDKSACSPRFRSGEAGRRGRGEVEGGSLKRDATPLDPPLSGGRAEVWQCLVGGKKRKENLLVEFGHGLKAEIMENNGDGVWNVKFNKSGANFLKIVEKIGQVPLPPYIKRKKDSIASLQNDRDCYQTVYADETKSGSVAAPTAGLHFTPALLKKLKKQGVRFEYVTLRVGLGTFAPVKVADITKHKMHAEWIEVKASVIERIKRVKLEGRRVIAVGTTSVRALESVFSHVILEPKAIESYGLEINQRDPIGRSFLAPSRMTDYAGWTDIFIYPGYKFKIVDGLITNFHLPKSTLLMLISAFACTERSRSNGRGKVLKAYREAIKKKYRFFSYGDAMLII